jgi:hypothetical protein
LLIALVVFGMPSFAYGQTSAPGRLMIVVEFEVKPEHRDQFIEVLKAQAQTTRTEDGCQQFDVTLQSTSWWSKHGAMRQRTLHTSTGHRSPSDCGPVGQKIS